MKFLGLIFLVVVIGVGVWLVARSVSAPTPVDKENDSTDTFTDVLNTAKVAVGSQLGGDVVIYDGIAVPRNTRVLDLSGRELEGSLKSEIVQLEALEVFDISNNNFTGLPAEVGRLSQLRHVDLSNNPLTGLPHELGNLPKLDTLDLRGTQAAPADIEVIRSLLSAAVIILID